MHKLRSAALVLIVLVVCSCEAPLSSSADIVAVVCRQMLGEVAIDPHNRTVEFSVEPLPLASLEVGVTVSDYANLATTPLVDGGWAIYTVQAQDGTEVIWQVKCTVSYGIAFDVDGQHYCLLHGVIDPEPSINAAVGAGTPLAVYISMFDMSMLLAAEADLDNRTTLKFQTGYLQMATLGAAEGETYTMDEEMFMYGGSTLCLGANDGFLIAVDHYGDPGDSVVGHFSGEATDA